MDLDPSNSDAGIPSVAPITLPKMPSAAQVLSYARTVGTSLGINPDIAQNLISTESGGNAAAVGPMTKSGRASGPAQLMPATAADIARRYGVDTSSWQGNVAGGLTHLRDLIAQNKGDVRLAVAAYHAGQGAVNRAHGIPNTSDGISTTADYVNRVTGGTQSDPNADLSDPNAIFSNAYQAADAYLKANPVIDDHKSPKNDDEEAGKEDPVVAYWKQQGASVSLGGSVSQSLPAGPAPAAQSSSPSLGQRFADTVAIPALKGAVGLGDTFMNLLDMATGGQLKKSASDFYRPKEAIQFLDGLRSQNAQQAQQEIQQAKGMWDTAKAYLSNPGELVSGLVQSVPETLLPVAAGQGLVAARIFSGARTAAIAAGATEDAAAVAGKLAVQNAEKTISNATNFGIFGAQGLASQYGEVRDQGGGYATAVATGIGRGLSDALIGKYVGAAGQKIGLGNITSGAAGGIARSAPVRIGAGALEGSAMMAPMSVADNAWMNAATGQPIMDGSGKSLVSGAINGAVFGGAMHAMNRGARPIEEETQAAPADAGEALPAGASQPAAGMASDAAVRTPMPADKIAAIDEHLAATQASTDGSGLADAPIAEPQSNARQEAKPAPATDLGAAVGNARVPDQEPAQPGEPAVQAKPETLSPAAPIAAPVPPGLDFVSWLSATGRRPSVAGTPEWNDSHAAYREYAAPAQSESVGTAQPTAEVQPAAQEAPAARSPSSAPAPKTLLGLVRRAGGVNVAHVADVTGESSPTKARAQPGVFTKNGMGLDQLAELLQQHQYMTEADIAREGSTSGANHAVDLLRRALGGEKIMNLADTEAHAAKMEEAKYKQDILQDADRFGIKAKFRPFPDIEKDVLRARDAEQAHEAGELTQEEKAHIDEGWGDEWVDDGSLDHIFDANREPSRPISDEELAAHERAIFGPEPEELSNEADAAAGKSTGDRREPATGEARGGEAVHRREGGERSPAEESRRAAGTAEPAGETDRGLLNAYTADELRAREESQRRAAEAEAAKQADLENRARADAERDSFSLTGSDREADVAAAHGQGGLFDAPAPTEKPGEPNAEQTAKTWGADNKFVTQARAEELRAKLRAKIGTLNSGIDPETMAIGAELAAFHIEAGARKFSDFAHAIASDLGTSVQRLRPYLRAWYNAARDMMEDHGHSIDGMDSPEQVRAELGRLMAEPEGGKPYTSKTTEEAPSDGHDQHSAEHLERDRADAVARDSLGQEDVRDGSGRDRGVGEQGLPLDEGRGDSSSGDLRVHGHEAAAAGEASDRPVRVEPPVADGSAPERGERDRSRDDGLEGSPVEPAGSDAAREAAHGGDAAVQKLARQRKANALAVKPGDIGNIRETLPFLMPGQQEDVATAERRFMKPDGYGMLFTNGTGTGKTYLGEGIINRFARQGKREILIVVPSDEIAQAWINSGPALELNIRTLENTSSSGKGITVTTYANFGANRTLADRTWDLVVADEAHWLTTNKSGDPTRALHALRAITKHPDGAYTRAEMLHRDLADKISDLRTRIEEADAAAKGMNGEDQQARSAAAKALPELSRQAEELDQQWKAAVEGVKADVKASQGEARPRALFLSATPFAYDKSIDWGNGYLFDYHAGQPEDGPSGTGGRPYNSGSNRERFFVQNFGYRMRYNKLTEPDAKVDSGLMQRQFNARLKRDGVLSGRQLDTPTDYDRKFQKVESEIGSKIDDGLDWLRNTDKGKYWGLYRLVQGQFDHLARRQLLEAIKAREVIPLIRQHLELGRKVAVFHDFNVGGSFDPFDVIKRIAESAPAEDNPEGTANQILAREVMEKRPDLFKLNIRGLGTPEAQLRAAFPGLMAFNGTIPKKDRRQAVRDFQTDDNGKNVMLLQSDAAREGISLHDTTGTHQRALYNLGLPTKPVAAMQIEGRINRVGQKSNAMFRYLDTGTSWERTAFASTIARRASAAENLGMGEQARALMDSFVSAYMESGDYPAGHEGEGTGGRARDSAANNSLSEWDRAKAFYYGTQKKDARTKAQEGKDYFATPEPVGLKMVQWGEPRPGESMLEPSAGHGAIARWFPDTTERTVVEPSPTLSSRLQLVSDARLVSDDFENLHTGANKFDVITMNPPFGSGGKMAIDHLAKAAKHLNDDGRIVAIIPTGPAADAKFEKWFHGEAERSIKPLAEHETLGPIYKGDVVETRAAGVQGGPVTGIEKGLGGEPRLAIKQSNGRLAYSPAEFITKIEKAGARSETYRPAEGLHLAADIQMPAATFERAGTKVATRIVVIDKTKAPSETVKRDLTGISSIDELFKRLEDMDVPKRPGEDMAEKAASEAPRAAQAATESTQQGTVERAQGEQVVEHTTGKGKVIRGIVRKGITLDEAKKIDAYTFRKDGGFFIREKYLKGAGEQADPEAKFSRSPLPEDQRIPREDLDAVKRRFQRAFPGIPFIIHDTEAKAPERLQREIQKASASGDVDAAYQDGEIHAFADRIRSIEHAEFVFAHEASHAGLDRMFGPAINDRMLDLYRANEGLKREADALRNEYGYSAVRATEEALADMGGNMVKLKGWDRVVAVARRVLRRMGMVREWSDNDIADLVMQARRAAAKPEASSFARGSAFSQTEPDRALHAYERQPDGTLDSLDTQLRPIDEAQLGTPLKEGTRAYAIHTDGSAEPHGSVLLREDAQGNPKAIANIQIDSESRKRGIGSQVVRSLAAMTPHGGQLGLERIQPGDAAKFWKDHGATFHNFSNDPAVEMDGHLSWGDHERARKAYEDRSQSLQPSGADTGAGEGAGSPRDGSAAPGGEGGQRANPDDSARFARAGQRPDEDNPVLKEARRKAGLVDHPSFPERIGNALRNAFSNVKAFATSSEFRSAAGAAFRQGGMDQFYGIQRAERRLLGNLPAEQSPYVAARLSTGASSVMRAIMLHGAPRWAENGQHLEKIEGSKSLLEVLDPVRDSLDDWIGWMVGNRAARLMAEGKEHNFTEDEIAELRKLGEGREDQFRKTANEFAAFKRSILDVAQQAGVINGETRPAWDHADWIPFYREMANGDPAAPGVKKGLSGQSSGIRSLKGGESALNDPLENIVCNFNHLIDASLKNNAILKTMDAMGDRVAERIGYNFTRALVPADQVKQQLALHGVPEDMVNMMPPEVFRGIRQMWAIEPPKDKDVIRIMRGGRAEYYRVSDPLLLKSLMSFQPLNIPGLGFARATRRILTSSVTAAPDFMLRNFMRDTFSTKIMGRDKVGLTAAMRGAVKSWKEAGGFEDMLFAGASFAGGHIDGHDPEAAARAIRRSLRDKGFSAAAQDEFMSSLIDSPAKLWEKYRLIGEGVENANREAVYEAAINAGKSKTAAAYEAKDLMDFSLRGGSSAYNLMADVIPFFNARVQGLYRLGRSNPKALAIKGAAMVTLPSLMLALANMNNKDYRDLPDWDKDSYWHFFTPAGHFRLPKPFEVGAIFATIPERAMAAAVGPDDDARKFLERAAWNIKDQLNLFDLPQIVKPAYEVATNKDSFRGTRIESLGDEQKLPAERYNGRTSDTLRAGIGMAPGLFNAAGVSPKQAQHLVEGYFGTFGSWALALSDAVVRHAEGQAPRAEYRLDDFPMLKSFYREDPARQSQFAEDLYEMAREYQQVMASVSQHQKLGEYREAQAVLDAHRDVLTVGGLLSGSTQALSTMSKQQDEIQRSPTMTPVEKRQAIDGLYTAKNDLARNAGLAARAAMNGIN